MQYVSFYRIIFSHSYQGKIWCKALLSGVFSTLIVLLALYALTLVFYYIRNAVLVSIMIHAVADLMSGPSYTKLLATVSLWKLLIFAVIVIITFFTLVEHGIYASVVMSIIVLLFRIARSNFWNIARMPPYNSTITNEKYQPETQTYLYIS